MSQQMSTNISDLPGPEEIEEIEDVEEEVYEQRYRDTEPIQHRNYQHQYVSERDLYEQEQPIKMNIRKSVESPSIFNIVRNEVTEENLLIFVIIFLATSHYTNDYTRKILSLLSFNIHTSNLTITFTKCALLLLLFIVVKNYILPYFKV